MGHVARCKTVKTALPIANDERVTRDRASKEIRTRLRKRVTARRSKRFAGAKPHERFGREALFHCCERALMDVPVGQRGATERLARNE